MVENNRPFDHPNTDGSGRLPSIFVQLVWTAVVGPWILWKIRNINDVHYWAWCVTAVRKVHVCLMI
jgi:hypothetical protein